LPLTFFTAKHYLDTKQWNKAEPLYRKIADASRQRLPSEVAEGLATVYREQGNVPRLLDALADVVGRSGNLQAVDGQAKQIAADGELLKSLAQVARRESNQADTGQGPARPLAVALLALEGKDFKTADEFFEAALKAEGAKKGEILLAWGLGLLLADRTTDSVRVLQRGVDQRAAGPDNPAFEYFLAGALEMDGHTDEAFKNARLAADAKKDNPRFALRPPWVLYHAKRYDAARAEYQAVLKKFDGIFDSDETREAMRDARSALSNIEVLQHKYPAAEEWLEQVLDEFPDNTGALNDLGYLWADQNKHLERSLRMIRKALEDDPKNMAYLDSLGWALFRLGRYGEAVEPLKAAAADPKADPAVLEHLGDAEEKAGDLAGALEVWRRALAGFEHDHEADKAHALRDKIARVESAVKAAAKPEPDKASSPSLDSLKPESPRPADPKPDEPAKP